DRQDLSRLWPTRAVLGLRMRSHPRRLGEAPSKAAGGNGPSQGQCTVLFSGRGRQAADRACRQPQARRPGRGINILTAPPVDPVPRAPQANANPPEGPRHVQPFDTIAKDATPCLGTRLDMASPAAYARAPPFSTAGQSYTQSQFA